MDKSVKFYTNQVSYAEIIENDAPSSLYGFHTYYSIVNVIMRFHLIDETLIDFNIQNATQLIKIITILRQLGVNVLDSEIETKHQDDIKIFWIGMVTIAVTVIFIIFVTIYNN